MRDTTMSRRGFLRSSAAALGLAGIASAGLAGCGSSAASDGGELNIFIWTEYVPDSVIEDFESEFGITVNASTFSTNEDMFAPKNRGTVPERTEEGCPVSMNLLEHGFLSDDEVLAYPGVTHAKGVHAVIECSQNIPCNPCQDACRKGCISIGENITSLPVVVGDAACVACGMCVASCPGQAIFLVDEDAGDGFSTVTLPYEFLPVPTAGTRGRGLSRSGEEICDAVVESVRCVSAFDHTNLLTMRVPEDCAMEGASCRTRHTAEFQRS